MKEPTKPTERRRVPRISVDLPVTVASGRKQYQWRATKLSEFGVHLVSKRKELVKEKEDVLVALNLEPKGSPLTLPGIVAYVTETGIGIRFKNLSLEQHASLKSYVLARGIGIEKP